MFIKQVESDAVKENIARIILEALPDWFGIQQAREEYIADSRGKPFFCAFDGEKPVGFLYLKETGRHTVELAVMGVLQKFHRQGIGRRLFEEAREKAIQMGYSFMQVKTVQMGRYGIYDDTNRFYLSLGFKELEVFPTLWDEGNPCQIYIMSIDRPGPPKKIKAVITDLDRTLLHTDKSVSDYTCAVLKRCRERGMFLMAATARPERAVSVYQEQIGFDALTALNGARIILPDRVLENSIDPQSAERILHHIVGIPDVVLSVETKEGLFSNIPVPEWNAKVFEGFPALPAKSAIYKILLGSDRQPIQPEAEKALTPDTYMTMAAGKLIQIMSSSATKWNGIRAMLKAAGVQSSEAVYFGDDYDDIESIKNCGIGVAVSNAIDEVLSIADFVAESNDRDGVARYIEENLL